MYWQSPSEANNSAFASTVAHSGLPVWPWIPSDSRSQFDEQYAPRGANSCSFACLRFAQLVFHKANKNLTKANPDRGRFLSNILKPGFFASPGRLRSGSRLNGPSIEEALEEAFRHVDLNWARSLIPLLHGTHRPFSPARMAELTAALEEIGLSAALILTCATHHRVYVHIPLPVPLFLVFDSARLFGSWASIVVHTSHAATTAHLTAMCGPGGPGDNLLLFCLTNDHGRQPAPKLGTDLSATTSARSDTLRLGSAETPHADPSAQPQHRADHSSAPVIASTGAYGDRSLESDAQIERDR
ncbi:hypothetical protein B0H17DRAFT_1196609 [Mycena rosella]|uniref:Uncharacterized protein n=1 Tax=Mycena rosella TaxID=1033263 RepID=A0AAD7GKA4_MYCRO|nr:hypothetical protein B0H17DRAFT_1196609 [Mycena rosella]